MREPGKRIISITSLISALLVLAWVLCSLSLGATAQEQHAGPMRKSTFAELTLDDEFKPLPGSCSYDVSLNGLRIGKATTEVNKDGKAFVFQVAAKFRSIINSLYKVRYRGQVAMTLDPIQPLHAVIEEQKGSKNRTVFVKFPQPSLIKAVQLEEKGGKKPTRTEIEISSESFVLDPSSTIFLLRGLQWQAGATEIFDIYTGRKQYQLEVFCRGTTVVEIDGRMRDVWEIVLQTRSLKEPREIKLSGFVVYLSKDSRREVLKIAGDCKFGRLVVSMRNYDEQDE